AVDEVLRLLQAETRDRTDDLDRLDLLVARARQNDVERRLLLGCSIAARSTRCSSARRRDCHRGRGGDAPLLLQLVLQIDELENAHLAELLDELRGISCHSRFPPPGCLRAQAPPVR